MPVSIPVNNAAFTKGASNGPAVANLAFATVGDLIVVSIWGWRASTPSIVALSGWTLAGSFTSPPTGTNLINSVFYRIRQAGDTNSPSWNMSSGMSGWATFAVGYRSTTGWGVSPVYGYASTTSGANIRTLVAPTVTNVAGEICTSECSSRVSNLSGVGAAGTNWNSLVDDVYSTFGGGNNTVLVGAYRTAAGSDPLTYTVSSVTANVVLTIANMISVRGIPSVPAAQLFCEV